jgi:lipid-A-disaccharide synthase
MFVVYIIAGELSGDAIGADIISLLKARFNKEIEILGVGGTKMLNAGLEKSLFDIKKISVMGYAEILLKLLELRSLIKATVDDIILTQPDLVITIDSPGFCYRVAKKVSEYNHDMKLVHVIAPSVWAYKEHRAELFAKIYCHLFSILPFEAPFFEKYGLNTTYIGHPVVHRNIKVNTEWLQKTYNIPNNTPILTLLPGSRAGEVKKILPIFLKTAILLKAKLPDLKVCIIYATDDIKLIVENILHKNIAQVSKNDFILISQDHKFDVIGISSAVIAKSGTNNVEVAACGVPFIVAYKVNFLTAWYIRLFIKIRHACLINIIANEEIIPEFIQENCNPIKMQQTLYNLITNPALAKAQKISAKKVLDILTLEKGSSPAKKIFSEICNILIK